MDCFCLKPKQSIKKMGKFTVNANWQKHTITISYYNVLRNYSFHFNQDKECHQCLPLNPFH